MNGTKGKTKGARRKISENASLAVNLMDLSLENLKMALPGSRITADELTNGWKIDSSDYIENITLIGQNMGGEFKKITIYNALSDDSLSVDFNEKDESVLGITFSAHYDPADSSDKIWAIKDLATEPAQ